jgi:hypothetical protein
MKKVIAILSLLSISSTVFAATCGSVNLQDDIQKIQSLSESELSSESKVILINQTKLAKVSEIIACSAARGLITKKDSDFAIMQLNIDRAQDIKKINQEAQYLETLLEDPSLSAGMRQLYKQAIQETPQRIKEKNDLLDTVIFHIKQRTQN